MGKVLMIGSDVHDRTIMTKFAIGRGIVEMRCFRNNSSGRNGMWRFFQGRAEQSDATRTVFVYEASGLGYGLYDEAHAVGFECHVLAPSKMERSPSHRRNKCDEKDAEQVLKHLRGYVLAGNDLPTVWIPDDETRDCREIVRCRMDLSDKSTKIKVQAQGLLKRYGIQRPSEMKKSWTKKHRTWMGKMSEESSSSLDYGARVYLRTLISQLDSIEKEMEILDKEIAKLSNRSKYKRQVKELVALKGVSTLTAMVFLTELGDCTRFPNRKKLGAYLGLVPSKYESGDANDRKGHITREGPYRIRKILCQAIWSRIRFDKETKAFYEKIKEKNPKKTKIAVVACMRRIGILMWHRSVDALTVSA